MSRKVRNNKGKTARERNERRQITLFWIIVSGYLAYHIFVAPHYIGGDSRMDLYCAVYPIAFGALAFGIWFRKDIAEYFTAKTPLAYKLLAIVLLPLMGVILSALTFGFAADIVSDVVLKTEAARHPIEIINAPVTGFRKSRNSSIGFELDGKTEMLSVRSGDVRPYADADPEAYFIEFSVRKTLFGSYLLESWEIKRKDDGR